MRVDLFPPTSSLILLSLEAASGVVARSSARSKSSVVGSGNSTAYL